MEGRGRWRTKPASASATVLRPTSWCNAGSRLTSATIMSNDQQSHAHGSAPPSATPAIDPVCGMKVNPLVAKGGSAEHEGVTYYFCNPRCRERFVATPSQYLKRGEAAAASTMAGSAAGPPNPRADHAPPATENRTAPATENRTAPPTVYVCPMDPEVRAVGPGPCPQCGMALEPEHPLPARTEWVCPMHPEVV